MCLVAFDAAHLWREGLIKETDAKEDRPSIAEYNTHRRSAAHTGHRFYQQGPTQKEPGWENTAIISTDSVASRIITSHKSSRDGGDREQMGWDRKGKGRSAKGTHKVIRCCFAVSYETCARLAYAYTWTAEVLSQALVVLKKTSKFQL